MQVEVRLAPLEFTKILLVVYGCVLPANLIKMDQFFFVQYLMKKAEF